MRNLYQCFHNINGNTYNISANVEVDNTNKKINFDYILRLFVENALKRWCSSMWLYSKDVVVEMVQKNKRNRLTQDGTLEGVEGRKHSNVVYDNE